MVKNLTGSKAVNLSTFVPYGLIILNSVDHLGQSAGTFIDLNILPQVLFDKLTISLKLKFANYKPSIGYFNLVASNRFDVENAQCYAQASWYGDA